MELDRTYYLKHFGLPEEALRMVLADPLAWCLIPPTESRRRNLLCAALAGIMGYTPLGNESRQEIAQLANMMAALSYLSGLVASRSSYTGMIALGYNMDPTRRALLSAGRSMTSDYPREVTLTFGVPTDFKELRAIPSCKYEGTNLVRGVSAPHRHRGETLHSEAAFGVTHDNLISVLREQSELPRDVTNAALGSNNRSKLATAMLRMPSTAGLVLLQVPIVSLAPAIAERADYRELIAVTRRQTNAVDARALGWKEHLLEERERVQGAATR